MSSGFCCRCWDALRARSARSFWVMWESESMVEVYALVVKVEAVRCERRYCGGGVLKR